MNGALVMAGVALLCAAGAGVLLMRAAPRESAIYRNRIAATMLAAAAIMLAAYAWALHSWEAGG